MNIFMWSGPRNVSTALMRSFENRKDTFVIDEPFYAYYLNKTQKNHPLRWKASSIETVKCLELRLEVYDRFLHQAYIEPTSICNQTGEWLF